MILSDVDIRRYIESGLIKIEPALDLETQLGPCSVDLRLGSEFKVFEYSRWPYIDVRQPFDPEEIMRTVVVPEDGVFIMQPGELVLATTIESITLPNNLLGRLEGRSSLGRLGIIVHGTAPRFDPGWSGRAVMELGNIGRIPVGLRPGMRICSMTFEELSSPAERPYGSRPNHKYAGQQGPLGSLLSMEANEPQTPDRR
jgi:dCTP deaminase